MNIDHEFTVSVPRRRAWEILTDIPTIAPCMPGAQLTGADGDVYSGKVKVKVGPVTTEYAGTASFLEKDGTAYRAVISAKGRDSRGGGNASATITAQLRDDGDHTVVRLETDLKITGKVAQFGSAMIGEVSEKLLGQFVDCLESTLVIHENGQEAAQTAEAPGSKRARRKPSATPEVDEPVPESPVVQLHPTPEPEAIDLVELAGRSVAKRLVPALIALVVVGLVIYRLVR